jgi:hypothetical protein
MQLAAELKVGEHAVRLWLEGAEQLPELIFLTAVEIILLDAETDRKRAS